MKNPNDGSLLHCLAEVKKANFSLVLHLLSLRVTLCAFSQNTEFAALYSDTIAYLTSALAAMLLMIPYTHGVPKKEHSRFEEEYEGRKTLVGGRFCL